MSTATASTILIVDDNKEFCQNTAAVLGGAGYQTLQATNAKVGWEQLQTNTIQLAILDMVMPDTDGLWFLEQVRQNPTYKTLPVVVLTNLSHGEKIGRAVIKGISRLLVKEDTSDSDLITTVREVLAE